MRVHASDTEPDVMALMLGGVALANLRRVTYGVEGRKVLLDVLRPEEFQRAPAAIRKRNRSPRRAHIPVGKKGQG